MMGVNRTEFENGLVLLTDKKEDTKKAALFVGVNVGSVDESEILNGGSHFNEHLLFKSNENRNARKIIEDLEYSGSIVNACTSWKYTGFYAKTPKTEVENALEILFEAATNFDYDEDEFELERQVILTEIRNYINSPDKYALMGLFIPTLFSGTPLEKKIDGTTESMSKVSKKALEDFKREYYIPNNTIISISGNFDEEKVTEMVSSTFGTLQKGHIPKKHKTSTQNQSVRKLETRSDIDQSYLEMGYKVPGYSGEDYFKLEMLSGILSEGLSSRMFHELREMRGIGYSVGNFFYPTGDEGMFICHVDGFDPKRAQETEKVICDIFNDLKTKPVSEKEFNGTKKLMVSKYDDSLEKITERAQMIFMSELLKIPFDFQEKEKYIGQVTKEDLMETAKKYLTEEYALTLLEPEND